MGRKPRIEYYGAIYHIIQRGNNKAFIFQEDEEKIQLLKIMGEAREIFDFYLLAYAIMDNHYHFVIKSHNIPISKIMHRINTRYAKYYNWRRERTGSPFEGRYRSLLVQNEAYLLRLVKYIHNNPTQAGICASMEEYKWSSDVFYRMNLDNLVNIDELLESFSEDRLHAITKYKELMDEPEEDYKTLRKIFEEEEIIGDEEFKKATNEDESKRTIPLDNILRSVCAAKVDYELIKEGSRKRYLTKYKQEYAMEALKHGYSTGEIAKHINITGGAIRRLFLNN